MVRLKDNGQTRSKLDIHVFQFHNGSIKSEAFDAAKWTNEEFQFHNGSIKRRRPNFHCDASWSVSIPQWFD